MPIPTVAFRCIAWGQALLLAVAAGALVPASPVLAQGPGLDENQLVQQLRPRPKTAEEIDEELAGGSTANSKALVKPGADGRCDVKEVASGSGHKNLIVEEDPRPNTPRATLDLQFGYASYQLTAADQRQLDALARALHHADLRAARYTITGHTDSSGDPTANLRLSCGRSTAVLAYLVQRGVASTRLKAYGFGSAKPVRPGNAADGANRRVEVRLDR